MSSCGGGGGGSSNLTGRTNISVTSINCETPTTICSATTASTPPTIDATANESMNMKNNHYLGNVGIRISVPKMEESDESETELSNIENTTIVKMRTNRNETATAAAAAAVTAPRPMSWEGELSEIEDDMEEDGENNLTNSCNNGEPPKIVPFLLNPASSNSIGNDIGTMNHNMSSIPYTTTPLPTTNDGIKPEYTEFMNETMSDNRTACGGSVNYLLDLKKDVNTKFQSDLNNLKFELGNHDTNSLCSPILARSKTTLLPPNPSPDSAIHSVYTHSSPSQSPLTSRHTPYTPSLSRNNSDASHSSCYSYSSEFSPTHSPIQSRHNMYNNFNSSPLHHSVLYRPLLESGENNQRQTSSTTALPTQLDDNPPYEGETVPSAGISRQQLINSPCPICGDKISGFHYGIFSCESCKGFFKRTVQNRKNYVCLRGAACPVTIATRKKCPACRFEKCLQRGMKLEAIREDRTRGGRSTYQCSYTLPNTMLNATIGPDGTNLPAGYRLNGPIFKSENHDGNSGSGSGGSCSRPRQTIPPLLQEIMDVEHLWQFNESELSRLNNQTQSTCDSDPMKNPLLASAGIINGDNANSDLIANLCSIADHRLYKIVKWCKSLPLFKHISIDDQICLLINAWCELLLFSCCFRSMTTPGEVRIGAGKSINLAQAKSNGLHACIERMLNLTDHLRRLRVDKYEYVAMKVIVLLQSDTSELVEPEKVRASQEKALQALQAYTLSHYPDSPAKFGELLLRIPELQRTCHVGKEMLTVKSKDGEDFNILMELLRGEH